ncbi:MAG: histidinol dehydrogenase [Solirubrobacterales bacterium]
MPEAGSGLLRARRWDGMDEDAREALLGRGLDRIFDRALLEQVGRLAEDVAERGDAAVAEALAEYDGVEIAPDSLAVAPEEIESAPGRIPEELLGAIRAAIEGSRAFNRELVKERGWRAEVSPGVEVGEKLTPVSSAGLFVPSGKGSFPSVLIQLGTPATVAGVPERAVVVPPMAGGGGEVDPAVLAVAAELGVDRVFRANGPAGVAALAIGTESVPRVRMVVGPGSPAVQAAQVVCQLKGCHTRMVMGPTESMVIADGSADPVLLAADLLIEAEHGEDSTVLLVTPEEELVEAVEDALGGMLDALPEERQRYATAALSKNGGAILVADLDRAVEVANEFAPEHLQLATADPEALLEGIEHSGEVLLGQATPFSFANYLLGVPAALPTSGFARVTGGVTAQTFLKAISVGKASPGAVAEAADDLVTLADHEGFPAHAEAIRVRRQVGFGE